MTEQEILPCPNPECRKRCVLHKLNRGLDDYQFWVECWDAGPVEAPGAPCGYSGPDASDGPGAIRLHNALPREEPWIEVAEKGLPEAVRGQTWDVVMGGGEVFELALRFKDGWFIDDCLEDDAVTHYRIHRAPKGPRLRP